MIIQAFNLGDLYALNNLKKILSHVVNLLVGSTWQLLMDAILLSYYTYKRKGLANTTFWNILFVQTLAQPRDLFLRGLKIAHGGVKAPQL